MGQIKRIRVLNKSGDTAVEWGVESPEQIAAAADEFLRLRSAGATMFAVADDKTTRRIEEFDPHLAEDNIVAVYQMTGGC